jgi:spore germination cell wall hydrolase CwlJ-like protein
LSEKKALTVFVLAAICVQIMVGPIVHAQQNTLTGYVTCSESNLPLKTGSVSIGNEKANIRNGRFSLQDLPTGAFEMEVEGPYRKVYSKTITIKRGKNHMDLTIPSQFSDNEIQLLARIAHAEAEGEGFQGQAAVAATVLNRVKSPKYPASVPEVVYQRINGIYQYSPVGDGRINLPAGQEALKAAHLALAGEDPTFGATGFFNPQKTADGWVRQHKVTTTIGGHVFFSY